MRVMFTSLLQKPEVFLGAFFECPGYSLLIYVMIGSAFNDVGPKFTCVDPTGDQPLLDMIVSVDKVCSSCDNHILIY